MLDIGHGFPYGRSIGRPAFKDAGQAKVSLRVAVFGSGPSRNLLVVMA